MAAYPLRLFITGQSALSKTAVNNLQELCEKEEVKKIFYPEIIDILENPEAAEKERILATPLLIKNEPEPRRRIIGDLSEADKILTILDIHV